MLEESKCHQCGTITDQDDLLEVSILSIRVSTRSELARYRSYFSSQEFADGSDSWIAYQEWIPRNVCQECVQVCGWCESAYAVGSKHSPDDNELVSTKYSGDEFFALRTNGAWATVTWEHQDELCLSCSNDAYVCDHCNTLSSRDDMNYVEPDEGLWCDSCLHDDAWWCDDCDRYVRDGVNCSCQRERLIHDYGYKPDPLFRNADGSIPGWSEVRVNKFPYLGFELEVESQGSNFSEGARLAIENSMDEDLFYLKQDGSLDNGFEIVTHPMALEYHQQLGYAFLKELGSLGFRAFQTGTCGLHVHVSRRGFNGRAHIWIFGNLIANNKAQMTRLAGRDSSRWASFDDLKSTVGFETKTRYNAHTHRYQAINFNNVDTLELRFFKASLRPERVLSALELTDAMVEYTRPLTSRDVKENALDWRNFARWVLAHNDEYPNLNHYVKTFRLVETQVSDNQTLVSTTTVDEEF